MKITATATPWGASQTVKKIIDGLTWYDTAGHGGLCISPTLANKYLSPNARSEAIKYAGSYWYEEDSQWKIPLFEKYDWLELMKDKGIFSKIPTKDELKKSIEQWHPDYFTKTTVEIPEFRQLKSGDLLFIDKEDSKPYTVLTFSQNSVIIEYNNTKYKLSNKSYLNRIQKVMRDGKVVNRHSV